jgi:hypothetical protein
MLRAATMDDWLQRIVQRAMALGADTPTADSQPLADNRRKRDNRDRDLEVPPRLTPKMRNGSLSSVGTGTTVDDREWQPGETVTWLILALAMLWDPALAVACTAAIAPDRLIEDSALQQ